MESLIGNRSVPFRKRCLWGALVLIMLPLLPLKGQKVRNSMDCRFTEYYNVLATDTSKMDGAYQMFYKETLVEKGTYSLGRRTGIWTFYNLGGSFEFQYDFDTDSLMRLAGSDIYHRRNERPSLFLGSPLVPYVFISSMVGYPLEAIEKGVKGKVVLTLRISEEGKILERFISQGLNSMMDTAVLNAAWKFPETWEWIPAKRGNQKVESLYNITVFFDLD